MNYITVHYRLVLFSLVCLCSFFSACSFHLQKKLENQGKTLKLLQQKSTQTDKTISVLRKNQADLSSALDEIRRNVQFLKGSIEEMQINLQNVLTDMKSTRQGFSARLQQREKLLTEIQKRLSVLESNSSISKPRPQQPTLTTSLSAENLYSSAFELFKAGDYENARKSFEKFLNLYPDSHLADNAQYWIGDSYFREKRYEEAISAFENVIKNFSNGNKVPDAYYKQALSFKEISETQIAKIILEKLISEFPSSNTAKLAKKQLEAIQ